MVWLEIRKGRGFADKIQKGKRMLGILFWILLLVGGVAALICVKK